MPALPGLMLALPESIFSWTRDDETRHAIRLDELREFLLHARNKLKRTREEEWLPTHGDLKYDQLLHREGHFQLIDFEYFTMAETSWDLGKYCAYAVPTEPKGWEHSVAAEEARKLFLDRYRELRPDATLDRFQIYEATNLALRAMVMMWGQRHGWMPAVESILALAMERLHEASEIQDRITAESRSALVGQTIEVLVDEPGIGRSHREAPEIDGIVALPPHHTPRQFATVTVTGAAGPDLEAA